MLPEGKKSLRQIDEVEDPVDRVRDLFTLLEYALVRSYPAAGREDAQQLLERNKDRFTDYRKVDYAREVRNCLGHAKRRATKAQVVAAEISLNQAIRDILAQPDFPPFLKSDVEGVATRLSQSRESASQQPDPQTSQSRSGDSGFDDNDGSAEAAHVNSARGTSSSPTKNFHRKLHVGFWYALAGTVALVAGLAFWLASPSFGDRASRISTGSREYPERTSLTANDPPPATSSAHPPPTPTQSVEITLKPLPVPPAGNGTVQTDDFINAGLSLSQTQLNVALLIDSAPTSNDLVVNGVLNILAQDHRFHFLGNAVRIDRLEKAGLLASLYAGDAPLVKKIVDRSGIDYVLLGKASHSCRKQTDLDPDLISCTLSLGTKLADRHGNIVNSANITAVGPGFTDSQALERADENAAKELTRKVLDAIPGRE